MPEYNCAVEMKNIIKRFPAVTANDDISLCVKPGEIHALLGENGAGKTTLMNVLYGLYMPDQGEIFLYGEKVDIRSPKDAIRLGIGMVHQHFTLVPPFTVLENIILGYNDSLILNLRNVRSKVIELIEKYRLGLDPDTPIWQLSVGQQQKVEILKILYRDAKILILDEPTAVLTPQEVKSLFEFLREMRKEGRSVIFISHKLNEVMEISDRITVLRKGKVVGTKDTSTVTQHELARMMVGRDVVFRIIKSMEKKLGKEMLRLDNVWVKGDEDVYVVKGVSLIINSGEVLGIAGVSGNGQKELAESIIGIRKVDKGDIFINGVNVSNKSPSEIISIGVAYLPEDREKVGYFREASIRDNLAFKIRYNFLYRKFFLNYKKMSQFADKLIHDYAIDTPNRNVPAKNLSGGNRQKLLIARELAVNPLLLIVNQPTRGLDVGATEYVRHKILEERRRGVATLLISEDLDEVLMLSDKVAVMYEGKIMGMVDPEKTSVDEIGLMMAGVKKVKAVDR